MRIQRMSQDGNPEGWLVPMHLYKPRRSFNMYLYWSSKLDVFKWPGFKYISEGAESDQYVTYVIFSHASPIFGEHKPSTSSIFRHLISDVWHAAFRMSKISITEFSNRGSRTSLIAVLYLAHGLKLSNGFLNILQWGPVRLVFSTLISEFEHTSSIIINLVCWSLSPTPRGGQMWPDKRNLSTAATDHHGQINQHSEK